jgi:hypothetical protein
MRAAHPNQARVIGDLHGPQADSVISKGAPIEDSRVLVPLLSKDQQVKTRSDDREQQDQDHQHDLGCGVTFGIHYVCQSEYVEDDGCESKKRTQHGISPFANVVDLGYEPAKSKVRQYAALPLCCACKHAQPSHE